VKLEQVDYLSGYLKLGFYQLDWVK
jgi:hypothetical protein